MENMPTEEISEEHIESNLNENNESTFTKFMKFNKPLSKMDKGVSRSKFG